MVENFPGSELLIDMHDGVTMAVPTSMLGKVKSFLITETKEIGKGLGLKHNQEMELAQDSNSLLSEWNYGN